MTYQLDVGTDWIDVIEALDLPTEDYGPVYEAQYEGTGRAFFYVGTSAPSAQHIGMAVPAGKLRIFRAYKAVDQHRVGVWVRVDDPGVLVVQAEA